MTLNLEQYPINPKQRDADAIRSEALKDSYIVTRKARNNNGLEREEEEERRRKNVGNKLEDEKEGSVQSLGENTLKFDCINGIGYNYFGVKIVFKVYGEYFKK